MGTSPEGLLPHLTQLPSLAPGTAPGTAQSPPGKYPLARPPAGFPVTQTLLLLCRSKEEDSLSSLETNMSAATQPATTGCLAQVPMPSSAALTFT